MGSKPHRASRLIRAPQVTNVPCVSVNRVATVKAGSILNGIPPKPNGYPDMNHWLFLATAIAFEVSGTVSMKLSEGFTKLVPSVLMFVLYAASFAALAVALKKIDVSIAYAIWAGVGTALIAIIGILYFKEPVSVLKGFSIFLIIAGVVGLNMSGTQH